MKKPYLKAWAFALLASVAGLTQSCRDDSLYEEPSWLGNSIYERLQEEGNYTYEKKYIEMFDNTDYVYTLNQGEELSAGWQTVYSVFEQWLASLEM
jgi:hypothetical protein